MEKVVDTVVIEKVRVDTVYMNNTGMSDEDVEEIIDQAVRSLEFEYDKAIIVKDSYKDLEALTYAMMIRKDLKIAMEGHTDDVGTEEYNLRLSKERVEAVKRFLVMNGIEESRIGTSYFGESKPIADNSTPEGRAKNRRVLITVSK